MADLIADVERKIAALKLRLPELEGKANKKERTAVNKEIYALENDEAYAAAVKAQLDGSRQQASQAEAEAHARKLKEEEEAREAQREAMEKAREARMAAAALEPETDGECHMSVNVLKKGDGETVPKKGEQVLVTYRGRFGDGTTHEGQDFSGKEFDSTWDNKKKEHKPLGFQLGAGRVIRGWEEAIKAMSLGESIEVTIGPKWAYRKGGIQDDDGKYIVPPNATLVFHMELVGVGSKKVA